MAIFLAYMALFHGRHAANQYFHQYFQRAAWQPTASEKYHQWHLSASDCRFQRWPSSSIASTLGCLDHCGDGVKPAIILGGRPSSKLCNEAEMFLETVAGLLLIIVMLWNGRRNYYRKRRRAIKLLSGWYHFNGSSSWKQYLHYYIFLLTQYKASMACWLHNIIPTTYLIIFSFWK